MDKPEVTTTYTETIRTINQGSISSEITKEEYERDTMPSGLPTSAYDNAIMRQFGCSEEEIDAYWNKKYALEQEINKKSWFRKFLNLFG